MNGFDLVVLFFVADAKVLNFFVWYRTFGFLKIKQNENLPATVRQRGPEVTDRSVRYFKISLFL